MKIPPKATILIVDDRPDNVKTLREILATDYKCIVATNGRQALERMKQRPDLVLLDVNMPGMDGFEVCRSLKENPETRDIPVIFVSAQGEVENVVEGLEVGGLDYIIKPINAAITQARVATHLGKARAEKELRSAKEAAEAANAAKAIFLAHMGHELRNPLNAILGPLGMISKTVKKGSKEERLANAALKSAHLLLSDLNNILDASKGEEGRLMLEKTTIYLEVILKDLLESFLPAVQSKGLELNLDITPNLPVQLIGDPTRLRQILINLVSNALKFTEKGGIIVKIQKKGESFKKHKLLFSVSDTGIGIPSEKQDSVFEAFIQVDSSIPRKYGGTGLGLNIVRQLVNLMDGDTWVESKVGKGSTFFVLLQLEAKGKDILQTDPLINRPGDLIEVREIGDNDLPKLAMLFQKFDRNLERGSADENSPEFIQIVKLLEQTRVRTEVRLLSNQVNDLDFNETRITLRSIAKTLAINIGENDVDTT